MKKLTTWLCLLIATFLPLTACSDVAIGTDDKAVRLVITEDQLLFDGKELDFEAPFSEWLEVLGYGYLLHGADDDRVHYFDDRVYFPEYGIELQLGRDREEDSQPKEEPFRILSNAKERPVYIVRVNLIPERKMEEINLNQETSIHGELDTEYDDFKRIEYFHPRYSGYGDYAVDFFGGIITDQTTLEDTVEMSEEKGSQFVWTGRDFRNIRYNKISASIVFGIPTSKGITSIMVESSEEVSDRAYQAYQQRIAERKAREKAEAEQSEVVAE